MVVRADMNSKHFGISMALRCFLRPGAAISTILQMHILPPSGGIYTLREHVCSVRGVVAAMQQLLIGLTADHESEHYYRGRYACVSDSGTLSPSTR